jgi:hypothetical protein
MARWWIGLLLLLNVAVLAWNLGALEPWGWGPDKTQDGPVVTVPIQTTAAEPASGAAVAAQDAASSASSALPAKAPASSPRPKPAAAVTSASEAN